jgi:hypothetical protein
MSLAVDRETPTNIGSCVAQVIVHWGDRMSILALTPVRSSMGYAYVFIVRRAADLRRTMAEHGSGYFALSLEQLRVIGGWTADCAERALSVFETRAGPDPRPRAAIEGIREFAGGGRRTARLRTLALEAHAAAREMGDPAAAAAARAAGGAAASAYTHPLADVHQTKHIVGPAAYAALALELDRDGDPSIGDAEVRWVIEHAPL